jgi:predicted aconitase
MARLAVEVKCQLKTTADFGALGYYVGKLAKINYPAFTGIQKASEEQLKVLGASMAATGSVPLFFVDGITPEWNVDDNAEKIMITKEELDKTKKEIEQNRQKPDLVTIGCPHASLDEIRQLAEMVSKKKPTCEFWVCTARKIKEEAVNRGYEKPILAAGGRIVADTCMVVCPLEQMGYKVTGTNSGKAAAYLPNLCKQRVAFGDVEDILYR